MTQSLRVISLNVWGIPRFSQDREVRLRALADALPTLQADVIGLQEVWAATDQQFLTRQAYNAGLTFAHYYRSGVMGSGLLTLSRYPIQEVGFYPYRMRSRPELLTQGDFWAGKGIGLARLQTPFGLLDFYNTHAVAQYAPDYQDDLAATRAANMWDAANFITAHSQYHPAVLVGDLNVNPHQVGYHILMTLASLTDGYDFVHPDDPSITFSLENPYNRHYRAPERIDYVCLRDGQAQQVIPHNAEIILQHQPDYPYKPYSDHYGVQVDFEVKPASHAPHHSTPAELRTALELLLKEVQKGLDEAVHRSQRWRWQALIALGLSLLLNPRRQAAYGLARAWGALAALGGALLGASLAGVFVAEEIQHLRAISSEIRARLRAVCD